MNHKQIRKIFLSFFKRKQHQIMNSASIVSKTDSSLMFTNAGMNIFKDFFIGKKQSQYSRIANFQKCLRITGKHNDLFEVGKDTYHHTMFEMLGNWSFGDYFKKESIKWAWELLTEVYKMDKSNIYVTIFEGNKEDKLSFDSESFQYWKNQIDDSKILFFDKKHNFWEMGKTGPCGPCTEIHVDLRNEKEKLKIPGKNLVNKKHPLVIELWNLVFIQFFRKSDGTLVKLPTFHVDTGMGFERLCMILQNKKSTYDTDLFTYLIKSIAQKTDQIYGVTDKIDIVIRIIADHMRSVVFAISDGIIPSKNKSGYVIRKILRRIIVTYYLTLKIKKPFLFQLVKPIICYIKNSYLNKLHLKDDISTIILREEKLFLKTINLGINKLYKIIEKLRANKCHLIAVKIIYWLYNTYGLPIEISKRITNKNKIQVFYSIFRKGSCK
ncbi:alanine--tRNA ligase-related protein [Candidatus Karelsulcia muelleri]